MTFYMDTDLNFFNLKKNFPYIFEDVLTKKKNEK